MGFKTLVAYQNAFELAMDLFHKSKEFPAEEKYDLTSQIRRSSRSVCAAIAEAYRKRQYEKHWKSKLSDADSENTETQLWLEFALACEYISSKEKKKFDNLSLEVGKLLNFMINNPGKFGL
ncbi:four helix bundle protein [Spongiivirga citrea]|uniref:Four helix bundle protein n=1 Tax=Spongiivirga citrea TaxID=1481457 RepID=A0A6M0CE73_9FLAO|nr:four helix bundle protein [Spongiivirga citrea]NER16148.1 four helix bundle protein [Spongiivirga citrea]